MVKDAANALNVKVVQVGEEAFAGSIISRMWSSIAAADILTAIVSEENGNVYYEIGLAHCQNKPVILLTSDPKQLKFDLRDHRAIVYDPKNPLAIRDELIRTVKAVLGFASDPAEFLAGVFAGSSTDQEAAPKLGLWKLTQTIAEELHLQLPVEVKRLEILSDSGELAVEVRDFMGRRANAIIDRNGIIRKARCT